MTVATLPQLRSNMKGLLGPGNFWLRALARRRLASLPTLPPRG